MGRQLFNLAKYSALTLTNGRFILTGIARGSSRRGFPKPDFWEASRYRVVTRDRRPLVPCPSMIASRTLANAMPHPLKIAATSGKKAVAPFANPQRFVAPAVLLLILLTTFL